MKKVLITIFLLSVITSLSASTMKQAEELFLAGEFEQVIDVLTEMLNKDAENYEALVMMGITYEEMEEYEKAVAYYDQAMTIKTESDILNRATKLREIMRDLINKGSEKKVFDVKYPDHHGGIMFGSVWCNDSAANFEYKTGSYSTYPLFSSGFYFLTNVSELIGVQSELRFVMKSSKYSTDSKEYTRKYYDIEIPVLLKIYFLQDDYHMPFYNIGLSAYGSSSGSDFLKETGFSCQMGLGYTSKELHGTFLGLFYEYELSRGLQIIYLMGGFSIY